MRLLLYDDYESLSLAAAESLIVLIRNRPEFVLGAASGESPRRMYQRLGQLARAEPDVFSRLLVVKLDEWHGLRQDDPATCETSLLQQFGLTLGMAEILASRKLFLLVSGAHKAGVLARLSVPELVDTFSRFAYVAARRRDMLLRSRRSGRICPRAAGGSSRTCVSNFD